MKFTNNIINVDPNAKQQPVNESELPAVTSMQELDERFSTDPNQNQQMRDTIDVSVDLLQRLYSGLYILQNVITSRFVGAEEAETIAHETIQQKLIVPLSHRFSDMKDFEFKVRMTTEGMAIEGTNTFSCTLLNAIQQSLVAPVADKPDAFLKSGYEDEDEFE